MKVRDRTIHDIHQIFCRDVYAWKELTKEQSYVQYILERGLAHIWTVKGPGKVQEKLSDIPYFTASYLCQKNPIWLLDCWHAITKKNVAPLYLEKVTSWTPQECEIHNNHLLDLIDIFDDFGWEDDESILDKQLLQSFVLRFGKDDWRTRQKQTEIDLETLEPYIARPKLEAHLQWTEHNFPEEEKDEEKIATLFFLVGVAHQEGELLLAKQYADQVFAYLEKVYREDQKLILDQKQTLVEFFQDIEEWTQAAEIMEDWFQIFCIDEPKRDLLWASRALEMAEFVDLDSPIRATKIYKEAIEILEVELGYLHSKTQEATRNLALCYAGQGLTVQATEILDTLCDELTARYGENHPQIFHTEIDKGLVYQKNPEVEYQYTAIQIYEDLMDRYEQTKSNTFEFERLYFCYSGTIKDVTEFGWEIDAEQKQKAMDCFQKYTSLVQTTYASQSKEHQDLLSKTIDFLMWNEEYDRVFPMICEDLNAKKEEWGEDHPITTSAKKTLQRLYERKEEFTKAETIAKEIFLSHQRNNRLYDEMTIGARYEIFENVLHQGEKKRAKAVLVQWYKDAKRDLHCDATEWKDIYYWMATGYDELEHLKKAEDFYQKGCEHAERVFGIASDEHLESLENHKLFVGCYDEEREGFDELMDILELCEEHLGEDHPTSMKYREQAILEGPRIEGEDLKVIHSLISTQWDLHELPTEDFADYSDDVLFAVEKLLEVKTNICIDLDLQDELTTCMKMIDEMQQINFYHSLFDVTIRKFGYYQEWDNMKHALQQCNLDDIEDPMEYMEDILDDFRSQKIKKGITIITKWTKAELR